MNKLASLLLFLIVACTAALAHPDERPGLNEQDREKWLSEMRTAKHTYLIRELSLSQEQQEAFFPIYDEMDDQLMKIAFDTREMEKKANDDKNATAEQLQDAAQALFMQKSREGEIEARYFEQFKQILTPRQLLRLKTAERKFTNKLVKHHTRSKEEGRSDGKKK